MHLNNEPKMNCFKVNVLLIKMTDQLHSNNLDHLAWTSEPSPAYFVFVKVMFN